MLQISPRRVAHIIIRAREIDAKVARWDSPGDASDAESILEARGSDATEGELRAFIARLNEDEKASLVALMWIGRGTFEPEDIAEAMETARAEASTPTENYLLGTPHLPDHLEDGLEKMGYSATDEEDDLL
ncbi:MAG: DUF3775 domain-containing protein [Brevirhabdus sp.]